MEGAMKKRLGRFRRPSWEAIFAREILPLLSFLDLYRILKIRNCDPLLLSGKVKGVTIGSERYFFRFIIYKEKKEVILGT